MEQPQAEKLLLKVARIKDLEFFIDESAELDKELNSQVTFNSVMHVHPDNDQIDFTVEVLFFITSAEESFMKGKVLTSFIVGNMKSFAEPDSNNLQLPEQSMGIMFSIALTHARALIAKAAMGSKFNNLYVPIIPNPGEMVKQMLNPPQ